MAHDITPPRMSSTNQTSFSILGIKIRVTDTFCAVSKLSVMPIIRHEFVWQGFSVRALNADLISISSVNTQLEWAWSAGVDASEPSPIRVRESP